MPSALARFGLNESMLASIAEIYSTRRFTVSDGGVESTSRSQQAGISQGCPLSPFLFGMVMTVLMSDARGKLSPNAQQACSEGGLEDVLFADDTLLISNSGAHIEEYMAAVESCGRDHGLQIHWGKVHLVAVGSNSSSSSVRAPSGDVIRPADSMLYLGATIHCDGKFGSELSRKIGAATGAFKALHAVCRNASLPMSRRLAILEAYVLSRLRYGVASAWLSKSDLRRLDGFHVRCLRKMLRIPVAYVSRISNKIVLQGAKQLPLSESIRAKQLKLLGQILTDPAKDLLKQVAFHHGNVMTPTTPAYVRRVGRPRHNWTEQLIAMVRPHTGTLQQWLLITSSKQLWDEAVARICAATYVT